MGFNVIALQNITGSDIMGNVAFLMLQAEWRQHAYEDATLTNVVIRTLAKQLN